VTPTHRLAGKVKKKEFLTRLEEDDGEEEEGGGRNQSQRATSQAGTTRREADSRPTPLPDGGAEQGAEQRVPGVDLARKGREEGRQKGKQGGGKSRRSVIGATGAIRVA